MKIAVGVTLKHLPLWLSSTRNAASKFIAATVVDWRPESSCLVMSNAGGVDSVIVRNGRPEVLRLEGLPLGLFASAAYEEISLRVDAGDTLVLASDGILECNDTRDREYGIKRLVQAMSLNSACASDLMRGIFESVRNHAAGAPPQDDQSMIILRVQGGERPVESSSLDNNE